FLVVSLSHPPPTPTLFPYTTLSRSLGHAHIGVGVHRQPGKAFVLDAASGFHTRTYRGRGLAQALLTELFVVYARHFHMDVDTVEDRKSTRLNSSHVKLSYAVFYLKK